MSDDVEDLLHQLFASASPRAPAAHFATVACRSPPRRSTPRPSSTGGMARASEEDEEGDIEERGGLIPRSARLLSTVESNLDLLVPLVVLFILSIAVIVYNLIRTQQVPCDPNKPLAKHFYCYNSSRPPGFHVDKLLPGR